jgi:hypothetical protein
MGTPVEGGSGSATDASRESKAKNLQDAADNAGIGKEFQDGMTAIKNDANFAMKADQLFQELISQIKV